MGVCPEGQTSRSIFAPGMRGGWQRPFLLVHSRMPTNHSVREAPSRLLLAPLASPMTNSRRDLLMVCPSVVVAPGVAVHNSSIFETEVTGDAGSVTLHLYRLHLSVSLIVVCLCVRDRDCTFHFVRSARESAARVPEEAKSHFETG